MNKFANAFQGGGGSGGGGSGIVREGATYFAPLDGSAEYSINTANDFTLGIFPDGVGDVSFMTLNITMTGAVGQTVTIASSVNITSMTVNGVMYNPWSVMNQGDCYQVIQTGAGTFKVG